MIELLAVIVVLAIVMMLAASTILPLMNRATRNAFALEGESAVDAATKVITLLELGLNVDGIGAAGTDNYQRGSNGSYCFTLEALAKSTYFTKDAKAVISSTDNGNKPAYEGKVVVKKGADGNYTYTVTMHNETLKLLNASSNPDGDKDVMDFPTSEQGNDMYKCKSTDVA